MGEPLTGPRPYNRRDGREIGAPRRGQRFAGARDGLDLGRFELGEALAPSHLIPGGAQHRGHGPITRRFHP